MVTGFTEARYRPESLLDYCSKVFAKVGLSDRDARTLGEALVEANLRGVDTHGVMRVPPYARGFLASELNPCPNLAVLSQKAGALLVDGDNGIGHLSAQEAMRIAVERAREHGIAAVGVRNTNHTGMLAFHSMVACSYDMIGFITSNGPASMAPWGGRRPDLCNNPFSFAIPAGRELPIVVDSASSAAARGKIRLAAQRGEPIPLGWALDAEGKPTTDAHKAMQGITLPFGEHKGYGLAVVFEVMAAALTGALLSFQVSKAFLVESATVMDSWRCGLFCIAINIGSFVPVEEFKSSVDRLIQTLKSSPPAQGFDRVFLPGEPEFRVKAERQRTGIPVPTAIKTQLARLAAELGISGPEPSA